MGLSRLDNFLKNTKGEILYVDPNNLDSTDSVQNQGNSLARPFKTLQRALIEAARFSYQKGVDNDRFGKTTVVLYPGEHIVDNRPGWIPIASNNYRLRSGATSGNLSPFDSTTNFDLRDDDNILYKLNSIYGGVIVPRGTSIVGMDLRKTKIIPRYVPDPTNDQIERSAIFRVTGACYFWQFSIFDGDAQGTVYKDYTTNKFIPNFSHHKLTCFEYADGVNDVDIDDDFISGSDGAFEKTDLEMYYEKVGLAYGSASGRQIEPDYPSSGLDIEPKVDEFRIVAPSGLTVGISSIRAGTGAVTSDVVSQKVDEPVAVTVGPDQTVCGGNTINLSGAITGGASTGTWTNFVEVRDSNGNAVAGAMRLDGAYYQRSVATDGDITMSGIGTGGGSISLGPNVFGLTVWPGKNSDGSDRLYICRGNTISQKNNSAVTNAWDNSITTIPGNNSTQYSYNIRYLKGVDLLYLPSGVWGGSDAWYKPLIRYHNGTSMFIATSSATDDLNLFLMDFAGDDEGNIIGVGRGWDNANTTFGPTTNYIYLNGPNHGGGNWQAGTLPTPVDVLPGSQQLVYCGMDSAEYRG